MTNAASESTSPPTPPSPPQPKQPTQGGKKDRKRERGERNVNGCIYIIIWVSHHTWVSSWQQSFLRAATFKENLPKTGSPDIRMSSRLSSNHTGVVDSGPGSGSNVLNTQWWAV